MDDSTIRLILWIALGFFMAFMMIWAFLGFLIVRFGFRLRKKVKHLSKGLQATGVVNYNRGPGLVNPAPKPMVAEEITRLVREELDRHNTTGGKL